MKVKKADNVKVSIIVAILLAIPFQPSIPEKPNTPKKKVIYVIYKTKFMGCAPGIINWTRKRNYKKRKHKLLNKQMTKY